MGTAPPTVRDFFTKYAPGSTTGFAAPRCREAVAEVCATPWESCGYKCMETCCAHSLEVLVGACLKRGNGKPFVLKGYSTHWPAAALKDDPGVCVTLSVCLSICLSVCLSLSDSAMA